MSVLNAEEVIRFFNSYGLRVNESSVKEWVKENNKKANKTSESRPVVEDDLHRYNNWCFVKGTVYEESINDTTKIARLLEENSLLKKEVEKLKDEKQQLEDLLGLNDWIWK
jgi:predicted RNase H-like nuclease (RuvC/YqgF family)